MYVKTKGFKYFDFVVHVLVFIFHKSIYVYIDIAHAKLRCMQDYKRLLVNLYLRLDRIK